MTLTRLSTLWYSFKFNISQTVRLLRDKVTIEGNHTQSIEWYRVCWPWLTSKLVARVCRHQLSFLFSPAFPLPSDPSQRIWLFTTMALYKFIYLLTYLLLFDTNVGTLTLTSFVSCCLAMQCPSIGCPSRIRTSMHSVAFFTVFVIRSVWKVGHNISHKHCPDQCRRTVMLMMQALEKADEAKNTADKSVKVIETSLRTIDDILGQIGEYL